MKAFIILMSLILLSGCTITQNVSSVPEDQVIEKIYVENNPDVHMKELVNELVSQIESIGIPAERFDGARPLNATHHLEYTANWAWDMAMYLTFFEAKLYADGILIGTATYDATRGGSNMGKFGKTAEKIRPLLEELLQNVDKATPENE